MSELPRQIRMSPGDFFMLVQDCWMRKVGLPGNVCCAILKLGNGFDVETLRQRIAGSPILDWLARARYSRPIPALTPALWRSTHAPREILFEHVAQTVIADKPSSLPDVVARRELDAGREAGLVFDVIRHPDGGSHLFLSWNHTHLDARGLDLLLLHLNGAASGRSVPSVQDFISPKQLGWSMSRWWPNAQLAHRSLKWLHESGKEPLFSLTPRGRPRKSCKNNYRLVAFSAEDTARIDARCQQFNCGFRRSHFYMAASVRALHEVAVARGNKDGAYMAPVPHDARKRGANGPIFSNHLSILFYRIEPKMAGRMSDILGELGRQMTDQIRDGFPECCMAALDLFKPLPKWYYMHQLGKPTKHKFATFSFSDSGETCAGLPEFCGGKVLDVTHLVPSWRPPGLVILFLRFGKRLSALISSVDDCMEPAEVDRMERDLCRALLEEAP